MIIKINHQPIIDFCKKGGDPEMCQMYRDMQVYQAQGALDIQDRFQQNEAYQTAADFYTGAKHAVLGTADFCNTVYDALPYKEVLNAGKAFLEFIQL